MIPRFLILESECMCLCALETCQGTWIRAVFFFFSFVLCPSLPLFIDRVSCSPGWFLTYYVSKADFELLILKLLIGKCLGYRCVSPCPSLVLFLKGKQQLLSRMPGFSEIWAHLYPVETVTMTYVPLLICFVIQKVTKRGKGKESLRWWTGGSTCLSGKQEGLV